MLQVGSSWTTLPTTLPPSVGTATNCSSVVYGRYKLVVVASGEGSKYQASGGSGELGTILSLRRDGSWKIDRPLPSLVCSANGSLTGGHSGNKYLAYALGKSQPGEFVSSATPAVLAQNRFLYAIVCNNTTPVKNSNYVIQNKKNAHGYIPQEELYVADLQAFMTKKPGLISNVLDFFGSVTCALGVGSNVAAKHAMFWNPVMEMQDCGSSLAANGIVVCAVGGFQTLSPKFYEVFSAKESVSRAAHMMILPPPETNTDDEDNDAAAPTARATAVGWIRLPDMNIRRKNLCTVIVDHYLYAVGGQDESGKPLASVERLNLSLLPDYAAVAIQTTPAKASSCASLVTHAEEAAWEPVASMETPRFGFSATTTSAGAENAIIVAGGCNTASGRLNSVECLVHTTHEQEGYDCHPVWKQLPNMQTPRMGASLAILNSKLIISGGTKTPGPFWGSGALDTIETLDIVVPIIGESQSASTRFTSPPTAPLPMPIATAEVYCEETGEGDDGFVSILHHGPPINPAHTSQRHHQHPASVASLASQAQPTAPSTLDDVYPAEASVELPLPIPPPQDERSSTAEDTLSPLPPPLLPPAAAAMPAEGEMGELPSDDDLSCAICLEHKKQVAFFCGHQACLKCAPLVDACHICRKPIEGRIQLFGD